MSHYEHQERVVSSEGVPYYIQSYGDDISYESTFGIPPSYDDYYVPMSNYAVDQMNNIHLNLIDQKWTACPDEPSHFLEGVGEPAAIEKDLIVPEAVQSQHHAADLHPAPIKDNFSTAPRTEVDKNSAVVQLTDQTVPKVDVVPLQQADLALLDSAPNVEAEVPKTIVSNSVIDAPTFQEQAVRGGKKAAAAVAVARPPQLEEKTLKNRIVRKKPTIKFKLLKN